jgi:hypothetical protein
VQGDHVLWYDNKYQKHQGKLQMHWIGPFIVVENRESGALKLEQLNVILRLGWVNGARLNPYFSSH